jgi:hypothetical protein
MAAFDKNAPVQHAVNRLGATLWELSTRDCVILRTTITPTQTSIQIDRPLPGEFTTKVHGDKTFASTEFNGFRVFWEVKTHDQEAAA